ncbi:MAG: AI-2E family transporter [Mycobacterium sp.]
MTSIGEASQPRRERGPRQPVPFRTILAAIGLVLLTGGLLWVLQHTTRVITWVLVAGFFAIVLTPLVDLLARKAKMRRGSAAALVFLAMIGLLAALLYSFIRPIVDQTTEFVDQFPTYVDQAKAGEGTVGKIVQRYKLDEWVEKNQARLRDSVNELGTSALTIARSVFNTIAATLTIAVLTFLLVLEAPARLRGLVAMLSPAHQQRATRLARDCARAVTGYVAGNLTISVIAGLCSYAFLAVIGVEFASVLALWVGFADLIPLIGATLGAIPAVGVAFLHSVPAGIATIIFYVIYQQFENQVLQVTIMARTVALSPLAVLVSVLIGVELFGLFGALLAIPFAGVIKVLATEVIRVRRPDLAAAAIAAMAELDHGRAEGSTNDETLLVAKKPIWPPRVLIGRLRRRSP